MEAVDDATTCTLATPKSTFPSSINLPRIAAMFKIYEPINVRTTKIAHTNTKLKVSSKS
jgi:hypothetical protein